ncbi:MAG: ATP-dependent Clp protease ATP-binding subunit [Treponema sp.]|nr:ATP-dependent Clp protease ATP-binding subunit [Treponema sp.]
MKNLSPRAKKILSLMAHDEARKFGSPQVLPEHILLSIIKSGEGIGFLALKELGLNPDDLKNKLEEYLSSISNSPTLDDIPKSRRYRTLLDIADIESAALHNNYIGTEHLLLSALREENSLAANFFADAHFTLKDIRVMVMGLQNENKSSVNDPAIESIVDSVFRSLLNDDFGTGLFGVFDEKKAAKSAIPVDKSDSAPQKQSFLAEYSRDLTKIAAESKDDPVVGRDKEIHRVIQILSRRTKNNPVLTGEPGVGKTAIVEGLAQHIAAGKVPSDLVKKRILSLDLAAMVAGTKYRGEFEERMKKMMKELQENKDIILFIDELHTIIGAGGPEGTMDASNIMKPALSRGEIQIIGATTTKEYRKHIEKDLALERRFQVVKVEEPGDKETEEILEGIKSKYEQFHRVSYDEDVIPAIVKLSRRYIPEKVLPDKAIDILDEAGASKKIQEEERPCELAELESSIEKLVEEKKNLVQNQDYENAALIRDKVIELKRRLDMYSDLWKKNVFTAKKRVSISDIEKIISEMTGIPVEQLTSSETERVIHMESELHNTVIGQNNAVSVISGAIRRARAGISSPKHPLGSFIFLGPTGVGKTQLAKALAKYLFGSEESLIRIDMSDFMEKHTASRLVGAPPGYVGYEEGGVLTEKVRRNPYSVVLLDEIEKAHPDIFNLLLQLLEEGELSDNLGHTVNFRNTLIIMTSNAGARQITNEGKVGFGTEEGLLSYSEIKAGALNEMKKLLSPELLNRIDDIIVFDALSKAEVAKILEIQLSELEERLAEKGLSLDVKPKAREYLVEHGYNPAMGARPMRRLIRKEVEDPLAMEMLSKPYSKNSIVTIESLKDGLKIKIKNPSEEKESVHHGYLGNVKCDVL